MQKKNGYFLSLMLLLSFPVYAGNVHSIIPRPHTVVEKEGHFVIDGRTSIVIEANDAEFHSVAGFLVNRFRDAAGFDTKITAGNTVGRNTIHIRQVDDLGKEAYRLTVSPENVLIESSSPKRSWTYFRRNTSILAATNVRKLVGNNVGIVRI